MSNSLLAKAFGVRSLGRGDALRPLDLTPFFLHSSYAFTRSIVSRQLPLRSTATSRLYRPCRSSRSLHCISAAPAALDRYLGGCTGHVAHPVRSIVSRQLPLRSTATSAAVPAMSLIPFAPFYFFPSLLSNLRKRAVV